MMTFVIILLILISIAALISAAYYETPYLKPLVDKWLNKGHGSKDEAPLCDFPTSDDANGQMMRNILQLFNEKQLYLNSSLTTSDVAKELGLHRNQISACCNSQNLRFPQIVNTYRVNYAKRMMRQHPHMKLNIIISESGFANETSFYRTFKTICGMTPAEWRAKKH